MKLTKLALVGAVSLTALAGEHQYLQQSKMVEH